jgi:xylan 1,4-beta-xylosidase
MRSAKLQIELQKQVHAQSWSNPVVPGDHPDPTIIRVGRTFWASATSGEWSPQFPLFRSTDLVHWQPAGAIFPVQPLWAKGDFWAPELVHDEVTNRFLVWYVGRQRHGPLSIAVATAPSPAGPWTDHGPVIAQPDGAIDPCFARDEHGAPYLIWKEDGNSVNRPTPIWAQALSEDLLTLSGPRTQLIVNDQPWEEGVVEGPYILRHAGRFYLFYAGNSCCGVACKYAEGVARADKLLGPWEKCPQNPIIPANHNWRCPGHGTAVHTAADDGGPARDYLLYHAYPAGGSIYVGREAVLDEIVWTQQGWPQVNSGTGPGETSPAPAIDFADDFSAPRLGGSWQWPVNTHPEIGVGNKALFLGIPRKSPLSDHPVESALLAVPRPASLHYRATVTLHMPRIAETNLWAGLATVGDPFNTIGLGVRGKTLSLWQRRGATQAILWQAELRAPGSIRLRSANVATKHHLQFSYSLDGEQWMQAGDEYDASDLPAWDRGLRIGLQLEGSQGLSATFSAFELRAQ